MSDIVHVITRAGIVSPEMVKELSRWGVLTDQTPIGLVPTSSEQLLTQLREALEVEHLVISRETDIEAFNYWVKNMRQGVLHLEAEEGLTGETPVSYSVLPSGEYLMPWQSGVLEDMIVNGLTDLTTAEGSSVRFGEARTLFFGNSMSFLACRPVKEDAHARRALPNSPQ